MMKPLMLVSIALLGIGIYLTYTKDSSFQSVDTGSVLIGSGAGLLLGDLI